jgi:UDP-GlcNAc3NAcA epimerase
MKFLTVVGARPQFVKAAPLSRELRKNHQEVLVHTGQHYDQGMSAVFFTELEIAEPDHNLGIGSGPHGSQTGAMLAALEEVMLSERPDAVIVYGDTNSTLAGALAAVKLNLPVAHVEAGLRSFNRRMPEEINRLVSDHVATWLFAPSQGAADQLEAEGITNGVHVVGDIMIDALRIHSPRAALPLSLGVTPGKYALATVHRAENTDDPERLQAILRGLGALELPVILPLHPRTRKMLAEFGLTIASSIRLVEPVGYLEMLALEASAAMILTDSGGVQKEAYHFGVPCLTLRDETEWTETLELGWNRLCGADADRIAAAARQLPARQTPRPALYGDGHAAERIVEALDGVKPALTRVT